ncbi:MAG TPA: SHOCT domain-containing protein, partial [Polyangiaceae bacterium]|nr:SHOCT domain-containing protein [Polyangiaceae bacterium]
RWQDLSTVHIRVGLFGADLGIGYHEGTDLAGGADRPPLWRTVRGLRPAQAQQVYRISQAHDQAWREKRRIRDLEEMRARAGGVQIGGGAVLGGALPAAGAVSSLDDMTARLQRAKDMVDKGLITDAEYEAIKAKLIAGF